MALHLDLPTLSCWLYYSESVNPGDPFSVELSQDGASSYKPLWSTKTSTHGWKKIRLSLDLPIPASSALKGVRWRKGTVPFFQRSEVGRKGIAVGIALSGDPPHRSVREELPHTAPALSRARNRSWG